MQETARASDTQKVVIASGATQSSTFVVAGYALASIEIPGGFKGNLSVLQSNQNPPAGNATHYPCKDDVSTGIWQTVVGIQKPGVYAMRPEFMVCRSAKLRATSAQTHEQTFYVFAKG